MRKGDVTPGFKDKGFFGPRGVRDLEDGVQATLQNFSRKLQEPVDNGEGLRTLFFGTWELD